MNEAEMKEVYAVYAGQVNATQFAYFVIDSIGHNDGKNHCSTKQGLFMSKPLYKASIGSIFKFRTDGENIRYDKKQSPVGFWLNQDDVAGWKLRNAPYIKLAKEKRSQATASVKELIMPLRNKYLTANYEERRYILAEVIRALTDGM